MEDIINFQGNALYKVNLDYFLSLNEKNYISYLLSNSSPINSLDNVNISNNRFVFKSKTLKNIKKIFDKYAKYYIKNVLEINHQLKSTNSWVTLNKPKSKHSPHIHPNTFISICFYPQLKSGDLVFETPSTPLNQNFNFSYDIIKPNKFNSPELILPLKQNDLVIFPGWISHSSTPNNSSIDRIMIGCNYFLSGEIGNTYDITNLDLG